MENNPTENDILFKRLVESIEKQQVTIRKLNHNIGILVFLVFIISIPTIFMIISIIGIITRFNG